MDNFNFDGEFRPRRSAFGTLGALETASRGGVARASASGGRTAREENGAAVERLFEEWRALRAAVFAVSRKYPGAADDFAKVAYDFASVCVSPEWKEFVA